MKVRLASVALAFAVVAGLFTMGATHTAAQPAEQAQRGPTAVLSGLVNALLSVNAQGSQVGLVNLNNSLNNLRALNNFLNRNNIDITLRNISVLSGNQLELLRNANINLSRVVAVSVLSTGDIIVFQR
jgi:hypothetical protein